MSIAPHIAPPHASLVLPRVRPLENGDHLSREEFERRWDAMPNLRHAELIEGVVYMAAALRQTFHGRPHSYIMAWLTSYALLSPGVDVGNASSIRLDLNNEPQPDGHLRLPAALGGKATVDEEGYVCGAPDLIVEVTASTVSIDMHLKLQLYRRHGVQEYVVWRTHDEEIDWFVLRDGEYQRLPLTSDGWYRSERFPGLRLRPQVLLHGFSDAIHAMMHEGMKSPEHAAFVERLKQIAPPTP